MFLQARQWGWQPSEFWNATIGEWWLEYDFHRPRQKGDFAGNLTRGDVDDLLDWLDEMNHKDNANGASQD